MLTAITILTEGLTVPKVTKMLPKNKQDVISMILTSDADYLDKTGMMVSTGE